MNKKILAAIITATVSGSAFAEVSVYDNNGVSVNVGGAAEVQIIQKYEYKTQDIERDIALSDGELTFDTKVEVSKDTKALGFFNAEFADGVYQNGELYVGLEDNALGTIKAGKTATAWDDTGIDKSIELAVTDVSFVLEVLTDAGEIDGHTPVFADGADVISWEKEFGVVRTKVATDLKTGEVDSKHVDAMVGVKAGDFDIRAFIQKGEYVNSDNVADYGYDVKAFALEAEYAKGDLNVAAGYYKVENEFADGDIGYTNMQVAASYAMDKTTVAGGVSLVELTDVEGVDYDTTNFYVNVTQELHENVAVYAEVGMNDISIKVDDQSASDSSVAYLVGMAVSF